MTWREKLESAFTGLGDWKVQLGIVLLLSAMTFQLGALYMMAYLIGSQAWGDALTLFLKAYVDATMNISLFVAFVSVCLFVAHYLRPSDAGLWTKLRF
jgi:hypothetical protein